MAYFGESSEAKVKVCKVCQSKSTHTEQCKQRKNKINKNPVEFQLKRSRMSGVRLVEHNLKNFPCSSQGHKGKIWLRLASSQNCSNVFRRVHSEYFQEDRAWGKTLHCSALYYYCLRFRLCTVWTVFYVLYAQLNSRHVHVLTLIDILLCHQTNGPTLSSFFN